ncbi:MAG: WYL domain-containing protein, partial [Clostridia bacterium]|nr:WYL domain-containing protein [Clostridia bacterium]
VVTTGRIKTMNESIYYAVDTLQEAIRLNQKVRFQYFQWDIHKEPALRRNGAYYLISPWSLMWDNENYYLVGFDAGENLIKHFRVDKMLRVTPVDAPREGREAFGAFDLPAYAQRHFGMFGGEVVKVTLEAENSMANILIDRFGKDIFIVPQGADHFRVTVSVAVSNQFFGWIMALGRGIRIVGPDTVVARMQAEIDRLRDQYQS